MTGIARTVIRGSAATAAAAGALAFGLAGVVPTEAQESNAITLRSYPVAIHQGTCQTLVAEAAYDLGLLAPRPLMAADEGGGLVDDTYTADEFYADEGNEELADDTEFLVDDADGDGVLDYGLDVDGDAALSDTEALDRPILWVSENDLGDLEAEGADGDAAELADLRDTPHAVVIHRGSIADTDYLGCAEIEGSVTDDGELSVAVKPIGENGMAGIAWFEEGDDGFLGIGGEGGEAAVHVFPSQVAQARGEVSTEPAS